MRDEKKVASRENPPKRERFCIEIAMDRTSVRLFRGTAYRRGASVGAKIRKSVAGTVFRRDWV